MLGTNEIVKVMMVYLDEEKFLNNREFYERVTNTAVKRPVRPAVFGH